MAGEQTGSKLPKWLTSASEVKIGIAMMVLCIFIFFGNFHIISALADRVSDLNFISRGVVESEKDVVIIAIDEKSEEVYGRWPWGRSIMVELVDRLSSFSPKVIALDIVFSYPEYRPDLLLSRRLLKDANPSGKIKSILQEAEQTADVDSRLAEAFKRAGNVVPGYFFITTQEEASQLKGGADVGYKTIRKFRYKSLKYPKGGHGDYVLAEGLDVKPNIPKLTKAARLTGYFNVFPDDDGIIRNFVNVVEFHGKLFPPAVIQMLRVYYDAGVKVTFADYGVTSITLGDKLIPTDEFGRTIINYYGEEGQFERISVVDVMTGNREKLKSKLHGKLLIVGATATGIYDIRFTPFGAMAGVEVEANYIQNIIDGRTMVRPSWFYIFDFISIILLGSIITLAMRRINIFSSGVLSLLLAVFYTVFQRYMADVFFMRMDVIYPYISILLVYSGIAFYKYYLESSQKKFIEGAFGHYLSPTVIKQLISDPSGLQLGGVKKEITAVFTDIAGFSTISEKMTPEELVALLNEYLTAMTDIILANGGTVDKYEGDAIICFFGAPLDDANHAKNAVIASIQMQEKLAQMRAVWKEQGQHQMRMRVGLNTGQVVVGNMGSRTRMDYTMMGDSVNLAARLEGINKQYGTEQMLSGYTLKHIGDDFHLRQLDSVRVVGKNEPVDIYELLGFKGKISESLLENAGLYEAGFRLHQQCRFAEAIEKLEQAEAALPTDKATGILKKRCLQYMETPPVDGWDGVYNITEK